MENVIPFKAATVSGHEQRDEFYQWSYWQKGLIP